MVQSLVDTMICNGPVTGKAMVCHSRMTSECHGHVTDGCHGSVTGE